MNDVKALLLCNNPIAIPGIKEFLFYGKVAVIAIPKRNKEMQQVLEQMTKETGTPLLLLNKKEYRAQLTQAIEQYGVNVGLMMTFPFIIPQEILNMPAKGFINFHYGLLPKCRGPHPILWHLLNNDPECGVTVHKVDEGIDTGPIIMQERIPIAENDTYGTLQGKLAFIAGRLAANLLKILSYGTMVPATAQNEADAAYFEMPVAADLTINWKEMDSAQIIRIINACNPWNKGAGAVVNNWFLGITEAEPAGKYEENNDTVPGTILACNKNDGLTVLTLGKEILRINIIYTQEGFFSGYRLADFGVNTGDVFA